jgi:predicted nucleotidyltransferase
MNAMDKNTDFRKIVRELKKNKVVEAIYLFGSYARGKQLPFSDIDVCVITRKGIPLYAKASLVSGSSQRIEIVAFWDLPVYIRYRILSEGKPLFVRDANFMGRVTVGTLREYFDFRPVIERFSEEYFGDRKWIEKGS